MRERPASMRSVFVVAFSACLVVALAACSGDGDVQGRPPSATATPLPVPSGPTGTLQLFVSNQSFDDDTVGIVVTIDGRTVVDEDFEVGSQHNWVTFPLVLPAGPRVVQARSDTGITLQEEVTVPAGGTHYAVIDYWDYKGEPKRLTFRESAEPMGFA